MNDYILFIILALLIITSFCYLNINSNMENFQTYFYDPFNYGTTGADPLTFYKYPVYRKPYRYPFQFYSSYPYPYMSYNPTNI